MSASGYTYNRLQNMLRIKNELTMQREFQNVVRNKMVFTNKLNNKNNVKHKHLCQSRNSNQGPLAPQSDKLPLDHRVN